MASDNSAFKNPLAALIGYQLRRASASLMTELGHDLAVIGLKPTEASVLALVDANPGITQSDLGRVLQIQRANMAPMAAALERRGLIARAKVDGRSHGLAVTGIGGELARAALDAMDRHERQIMSVMPGSTRDVFANVLPALWRDPNP